jgi:hypothetical protein
MTQFHKFKCQRVSDIHRPAYRRVERAMRHIVVIIRNHRYHRRMSPRRQESVTLGICQKFLIHIAFCNQNGLLEPEPCHGIMPTTNDIYQQEYAMLSPEETDTLYKRMELHRFHLSTFLNQKTMFGDAHVPPVVLLGIRDNRNSIQHLKDILRGEELEVNDQADDFDPVAQVTSTAIPPPVVISEEELEDLWLQAEEAFKKYDWEKAEPLLVQVASANPRFREVQRLLSRTKKNLGLLAEYRRLCALDDNQWREAKTKFDFIRRESQNFPDSQNLLGWIELQEWCGNLYELAQCYWWNNHLWDSREEEQSF